jgi:HEAT repeat protein
VTGVQTCALPISSTLAFVCALSTSAAYAQQELTLAEATTALQSGDQATVEAGIQALGLIGTKPALDLLVERVHRGLPRDLLISAIFTIGAMGLPDGAALLAELTRHRSADVRARAVEMLAALQAPGAAETLSQALADPDANVRALAATGLGDLHATAALDRLFIALDRGVLEASAAIGKAVSSQEVPRLLGYLGRMPLRTLAPALQTVITRADIDEAARLQVVARVAELATREVKSFLNDLIQSQGPNLPARVRAAVTTSAQQIAD